MGSLVLPCPRMTCSEDQQRVRSVEKMKEGGESSEVGPLCSAPCLAGWVIMDQCRNALWLCLEGRGLPTQGRGVLGALR